MFRLGDLELLRDRENRDMNAIKSEKKKKKTKKRPSSPEM